MEQIGVDQTYGQSGHKPNYLQYLIIFAVLAGLTAAEIFAATIIPVHAIRTPILLALASAKVVLVAMFYMHLKMDSKWYRYMFLVPIPFVVLIMGALLMGGL